MANTAREQALTRGDRSTAAATADRTVAMDVTTISTPTPAGWKQDVDESSGPIQAGTVRLMGSEEVLDPLEKADNAYKAYRLSPHLEAVIAALVTNVYSAPYTLTPVLNVDDRRGREKLRACLEYEKANGDLDAEVEISEEELDKAVEWFKRRSAREQIFLNAWFKQACIESTYNAMRMILGQDKEIQGNAYIEVVRGADGKPKHLVWAPSWSIRAKKLGPYMYCDVRVRDTDVGEWRKEKQPRRFRSYVQLDGKGNVVARYKEFGDPRIMSRATGRYYADLETMNAVEQKREVDEEGKEAIVVPLPATELLQIKIPYAGSSAYGKPRWSSVYPDLVGMRDLAEHNRLIVTDQEIPNILAFIAGGRADPASVTRVEEQLQNREEGPKGIMIVQAYAAGQGPAGPSQTPEISVLKLRDAMHSDGLGVNYSKSGYKKTHLAFRTPRVCIGDDEGINRSAAFGMFRFVESQVWDPERQDYDDMMNERFFPELGVRTLRYKTLSRTPKDPELVSNIVSTLAKAGVLTPDESREIAEEIFNKDLRDLDGLWSRLPMTILNAILQTKNQITAAAVLGSEEEKGDLLTKLRDAVLGDFARSGIKVQGGPDAKQPDAEPVEDGDGDNGGDQPST